MVSDSGNTGTAKKKTGRPRGRKSSYTVSDKALAQRTKNGRDVFCTNYPDTQEKAEYNTKLISHIMQIQEIRQHANRRDINSLKSCFLNYIKLCQMNGFPIQNLAAYSAMGFDNRTFSAWAMRDDPEIREFASFVRSTCALFREGMVSDGKLNPVIGIFWQRNFDGLRNDTEQVQAINEQNEDENFSSKSYKEKYKNLIGD